MTDAIRCVRVSPDGTELACGDWLGNIRIYDLTNLQSIEQKKFIEAHNMEVICLAYSPQISSPNRFWLASGSRDRLITIFDSS
jgi:WD40 repeat protein